MKSRAKDTNPMHKVALPEEVAKAIVFLASDRAKRITGHILKVDGGKSLTNLSTVDWYGTDVMNRRFEAPQGGVSKISNFWKKVKTSLLDATQGAPVGSTDWINAHQKSNWATHDAEAHEKVDLDYGAYRIDADKNIEYERANLRGGANYPAKAEYRTYDRYTYGGGRSGGGMGDPRGSAGRRTHF